MSHWRDVFLDKIVAMPKLKRVLIEVFSDKQMEIDPEDVAIIGDITEFPANKRIVCDVSLCEHEFRFMISIYIVDEQLMTEQDHEVVSKICSKLNCRALVEDVNVIATNLMYLVHPSGHHEHFTVKNSEKLEGMHIGASYFS
ncbi:hypothetical protein [Hazenella coriacea]|uniref:Uncharacterized protein n=1 Tax=Hazenella coriacea TaxID=1179467 RepID=A0A4R3LBM6_9BACL|nr:hypothetical protein [Hazenella coriacea]TCS96615.1 hypothetical protein EDD58_101251 [Hazenella coriacea]